MSAAAEREAAERRTAEAFERSAWQDPRSDYRATLRRLREVDATAFESAVRDYETSVVARLGDPDVDPVAAWLQYGERLAGWIGAGRTVRIDANGRAEETDSIDNEPTLLLHLPSDEAAPAIVVACPREPSAAQRATLALLVEGRSHAPRGGYSE